jgi:2-polyprenyl-6-methoxyphenol hydroxylase-like FAD-dependent oxidoreductase
MERKEFLDHLYTTLPDNSKVKFGKRVRSIAEDAHKVEVLCEDGTRETGDIVIGCDGVHSKVRALMWENAITEDPTLIPMGEKIGR